MKLRILLSVAAIYMTIVGLGFIFAPRTIGIGAVPVDASAALLAYLRLFGSPFLGIAVLNWTARNSEPSTARNAIILGNIVGFVAIAALDVWGLFSGGRQITKGFAIIHLLFALAFIWVGRTSQTYRIRGSNDG
ncbi:hypothetical protein CEN44_19730 [Fischerella muscicola CCMEE 5323]|uniref:DUF4345 domain-containing protein n=2 Tax=Hapalosiphonaceae TaxID=1892263 RepID=A0A2N6JZ74_FISMU|nr:hypothetical protein CEN44_19730 [Fischerella muscicola CCMEE 5323]